MLPNEFEKMKRIVAHTEGIVKGISAWNSIASIFFDASSERRSLFLFVSILAPKKQNFFIIV